VEILELVTAATEEYDGTSWTSVNPMNTARQDLAGAGIQTAALAFGGSAPPFTGATEEYDGTTWTTSPASLNTARNSLAGAGTQTAALAFGGIWSSCYSSNRRMDRCRSTINKNNYGKLIWQNI
jgi:hypothetical protein